MRIQCAKLAVYNTRAVDLLERWQEHRVPCGDVDAIAGPQPDSMAALRERFPLRVVKRQHLARTLCVRFSAAGLGADMKKLTTCVVAITSFIGTSAFAADMAVKAPPAPPPAPVWNWTGWYAGVNLGASFGNARTDFNAASGSGFLSFVSFQGPFTLPGFAGSNREYPDGFMGGGQIGYNWQFSPIWVVGLEADFQGAIEKDSNTLTNSFTGPGIITIGPPGTFSVPGSRVLDYQTKIDWFGTARLRAGYVWGNGNVFSYLTGGLAYGEVKIDGTNTTSLVCPTCANGQVIPFSQPFGHSNVNTGWVVGYGTEGRLGVSNWSWKIEGLYMDLGHLDATASSVTSFTAIPSAVTTIHATVGPVSTQTHFTDGILRGGLNYKFY
jgi:outer membrane immunogenic protein